LIARIKARKVNHAHAHESSGGSGQEAGQPLPSLSGKAASQGHVRTGAG
jgi:hypothetical protein